MTRKRSPFRVAVILLGILFVAIQLVPYGRDHANPPVTAAAPWNSPATKALAERACFDCHSNQTRWPAYANIAPASWLLQYDVAEGREHLNFSEWNRPQEHAKDAPEEVLEKEMPPNVYLLMHPEARLSDAERKALADGLAATVAGSRLPRIGRTDDDDED